MQTNIYCAKHTVHKYTRTRTYISLEASNQLVINSAALKSVYTIDEHINDYTA